MLSRLFLLSGLFVVPATALAQSETPRQPAWVAGALKFVPPGKTAGLALRTDEGALTGLLPVFPANADDPKSPASAFDPGEVLVVTLRRAGDALEAVSAQLRSRTASDTSDVQGTASRETTDDLAETNLALRDKAKDLPPGTTPCSLSAWSVDRDKNGLNVRSEPSTKGRILGTLPPPFMFKSKGRENTPPGGWLTEFKIIGYRDGWFLIEGATPPGKDYEDESIYPRSAPKPYSGRGWVAASKVGASFANGATRMGGLFQAPHVDAAWTEVKDKNGNTISADGGPDRILACSGLWALVEVAGKRGWWRSLCSNQVTNCS